MGEEQKKTSATAYACIIAAASLFVYVTAYGILRSQDVLLYDVTYWKGANGTTYSGYGVVANRYWEESTPLQKLLGPPAQSAYFPLCEIETAVWRKIKVY